MHLVSDDPNIEWELHPTHTCFDDAMDFLEIRCKQNPLNFKMNQHVFRLVHGILVNLHNEKYSHAWVEELIGKEWFVWDCRLYKGERAHAKFSRDEFHKEMRVIDHTKYTIHEMLHLNLKFENYGPWEQKYRDLCSDKKRVFL